ncbi:DUF1376 domain-containing protein [Azospirillum sp. B4]|uniref:DUF1376 domain-containing protein n=1 Tax=Azospirillum sp. B4 TaxID=95605 RepID=UPI000349EFE5|nr:DUF1376 domain-containing protein [Azospirillum sp. B4]
MDAEEKALFIMRCPKDELARTEFMDPMVELVWRRLQDHIYATGDRVPDRDSEVARVTKAGNRWRRIKAELIDRGLIEVLDGRVTNGRCRDELARVAKSLAGKSAGGRASGQSRKARGTKSPPAAVSGGPEAAEKVEEKSEISAEKPDVHGGGGSGVCEGEFSEANALKCNETPPTAVQTAVGAAVGSAAPTKPVNHNLPPYIPLSAEDSLLLNRAQVLARGGSVALAQAKTWPVQDLRAMVQRGLVDAAVVAALGVVPGLPAGAASGTVAGLGRGA